MKAAWLSLVLLLAWPWAGRAQVAVPAPAAPAPGTTTAFYTADFRPASPTDSGAYRVETEYRDAAGGIIRVYYPSGQLKQFSAYADVRRGVLHGTRTSWYENGRLQTKEDYLLGQRHGELLTYYPDGTLKRRDQFVRGRSGVGTCYGPAGGPVPYFAYEQLPLYPGGDARLAKELRDGVRLNNQEAAALRREAIVVNQSMKLAANQRVSQIWKCQVDVELTVTPQGRVASARVVQSPTPSLNAAAVRAVLALKGLFVPARRDGQAVPSLLTVPVYYTVRLPTEPQKPNISQRRAEEVAPRVQQESWGKP